MKLNDTQITHCQIIISGLVKFKETYEELTDHVLTSIENMPQSNLPFDELVMQVIDRDFGGKENVKELEKQREKIVLEQLRHKLWKNMVQHIKIPLIGFTLLLAATAYFTVGIYISRRVFTMVIFAVALTPFLILLFTELRRKIFRPGIKKSVKDGVIFTVAYYALTVLNLFNFLPNLFVDSENYHFLTNCNSAIVIVIMVFFSIYTLSFIKLYQEEQSMQLV